MTLPRADYRAWRSEAAERDHAYASAWRAGVESAKHEHHRLLVVAGIVGACLVFGRRLHPVTRLVVVLVLVAVSPVLVTVAAVELTVRQHRRCRSWRRTLAYVVSWLVSSVLVLIALTSWSVWPLVVVVAIVVAWTIGPRVRRHGGHSPKGPGNGGGVDPSWPALAPFTDAGATLPGIPGA